MDAAGGGLPETLCEPHSHYYTCKYGTHIINYKDCTKTISYL